MKDIFGCVYCGEKVNYDEKTHQLICSNSDCPEDDPSYGLNPLAGCVWVQKGKTWESVPKKYVLDHIKEFIDGAE